ncbi:protein POLYCHOME-like [Coffea eugenioides]|uniref:protein POLYCHOME-like n=1 Tax=Coffea eugenioides TaxID=49369 RepID=UPI000F60E302|nr:protein POLYCHOME-like [Coffea eugenioides]
MPEARDRISRAEDLAAIYTRRRQSIISGGSGNGNLSSGGISVLADEAMDVGPTTPFRWGAMAMTGTRGGGMGVADGSVGGGFERGSLGTPRIWRGRHLQMSPVRVIGRQNMSPTVRGSRGRVRGRGRGRGGSVLPNWYPRTPLQDVTAIVRAIERRRASLREGEGHQLESPIPQEQTVHDPTVSTSGAQLEHDISMITPYPTIRSRACPVSVGKVPKILLDITNQNAGETAFLTPEKKLLNSIDTVEKVVMEELHKLKRTPIAKKAEREKKVKTLMSMR